MCRFASTPAMGGRSAGADVRFASPPSRPAPGARPGRGPPCRRDRHLHLGERPLVGDHRHSAGGGVRAALGRRRRTRDRDRVLAQWLETVARGLEFVCDVRVGGTHGREVEVDRPVGACSRRATARSRATSPPSPSSPTAGTTGCGGSSSRTSPTSSSSSTCGASCSTRRRRSRRSPAGGPRTPCGTCTRRWASIPTTLPRMRSLWAGLWESEGYLGAEFRIVHA